MKRAKLLFAAAAVVAVFLPAISRAQPVAYVTGVGGIFVTSKDPKALAAWYRDVLGIPLQQWGGAILRYDAPGHPPPMVLWNPHANRVGRGGAFEA